MPTRLVYYQEPYQTEWTSRVLEVVPRGRQTAVALEETIFYPEGGGQPSDQGEILAASEGASGKLRVELVQLKNGTVWHQGKLLGELKAGDSVRLNLKWPHRHHNMRTHTAGHLIHDVLMTLADGLRPLRGNHGSKAFIEHEGQADPGLREELERRVNETLRQDLPVRMQESSAGEIKEHCRFLPPSLPANKPLRTLKIGGFPPMPDGGVHVKSTKEIGSIVIQEIACPEGRTIIRYRVTGGSEQ